jgi:hypothetical protein
MRSRIGFTRSTGDETFDREERKAAGQLQFDLVAIVFPPFGERWQDREAAFKMTDGFEMGQARCGILAGFQPLIDGALDGAGCG